MNDAGRPIGLHQVTALEAGPTDFIELAAKAGCAEVSLFAHQPNPDSGFPLVTRDNLGAVAARLRDSGVRLANVDCLLLHPHAQPAEFQPALDIGGELGARGAVVLLFDDDEARVLDKLGALGTLGAAAGLNIAVELLAMTPAWNTLDSLAQLLSRVGLSNVVLGIDVLHLVRSGGTPQQLGEINPALYGYAQLCDGADLTPRTDYGAEAVGDRLAPGDGIFPLPEFLAALPPGLPLELEVPQPQDRPAAERVAHAVAGARGLLASV